MPATPVADKPKYDEDAAFERVMQACRAAQAKGWAITPGRYFLAEGRDLRQCCPIGAFAIEADINPRADDHAQNKAWRLWRKEVGLPVSEVGRFTQTFDDAVLTASGARAARLARRVRAALWPDCTP